MGIIFYFSLEKRRLRVLIFFFLFYIHLLKSIGKKDLDLEMHSIRNNRPKLEYLAKYEEKHIMKVYKYWNKLTRKAVESTSMEIFRTGLDGVLRNLMQLVLL